MRRTHVFIGFIGLLLLPLAAGRAALAQQRRDVTFTPAAVNESIEKAKAFLYSKQSADGTWEEVPQPLPPDSEASRGEAGQSPKVGQWGGRTALAVYALLAAGEQPSDEKLTRAVAFLKAAEITGTYAVGIRLLAMTYLPYDDAVKRVVERDAGLLLRSVKTQGDAAGHYDYNVFVRDDAKYFSHSRSQYGVLGMWAAARMGYRVDERYWQLVDAGWRRNQKPSGGWTYDNTGGTRDEETPGMTAAGVASLYITTDFLAGNRATGTGGNLADANIDAGLAWLAANFNNLDPDERVRQSWTYVTLYGVERIAAAGGLRYVGDNDWYTRGAAWLLEEQNRDGSWRRGNATDTSFALLFLGRGRSPLLAAKLAHSSTDKRGEARRPDWHQRPRDLANLAEFAGNGLERELHWQIMSADRPVDEWLDAPILYLAGSHALNLSDEVKAKLRDYARQGGLIVLNADGGRKAFAESAAALGAELFPDYTFRPLEPTHSIFNLQYPLSKARRLPRLTGLSNGARELMILIPTNDIGRDWQTRKDETSLQLGANLYLYAIDRNGMRYKGERFAVAKREDRTPRQRANVGRVKYEGNWDPEPAGWDRLSAIMHNDYDTEVTVRPLDPAGDDLTDIDVLHLTGTADFTLSAEARAKLKAFIEAGGTLLADAAGGSGAFASAAERELREIVGETDAAALSQPLGAGHSLYADGTALPPLTVAYRLDAETRLGAPKGPRLRGIERGGRLAVVWSPEDLSVGLVGMPVAGVIGYAPDTATALVARVVRAAGK